MSCRSIGWLKDSEDGPSIVYAIEPGHWQWDFVNLKVPRVQFTHGVLYVRNGPASFTP